jgi:hypothetical protein
MPIKISCTVRLTLLQLAGICAAAQTAPPPDALTLVGGSSVPGYVTSIACTVAGAEVAFQKGLPGQGAGLAVKATSAHILELKLGPVVLSGTASNQLPAQDLQPLKDYVRGDPASRAQPAMGSQTLSLSDTLPLLCFQAGPRTFPGALNISGTDTFGAQVQRLISGDLIAMSVPAPADMVRGALTPTFEFNTSYGDNVKGSVTTKTSQIYFGKFQLEDQLSQRNQDTKLLIFGEEYHSFSQGIALLQVYGMGFRQALAKSFHVEGEATYMHETPFRPFTTFTSPAVRFAEDYTAVPGNGRVTLAENMEAVAPFDSARDLYFRGGASLDIKIGPQPVAATCPCPVNDPNSQKPTTAVTINYDDNYYRNSPKGYKQNYVKLTIGIKYSWK